MKYRNAPQEKWNNLRIKRGGARPGRGRTCADAPVYLAESRLQALLGVEQSIRMEIFSRPAVADGRHHY